MLWLFQSRSARAISVEVEARLGAFQFGTCAVLHGEPHPVRARRLTIST